MDRTNSPHHQLVTQFAADPLDVNPFTVNRQRLASLTDSSNANLRFDPAADQPTDQLTDQLNRKTQQISVQVGLMEKSFGLYCDALNSLDERLVQLQRQNIHCFNLLCSFEEFLDSYESDSTVDCFEWFFGLELLKEELDDFDEDSNQLIQFLTDKMERLYDRFATAKNQLLNADQTLANLDQMADQLLEINEQMDTAELELDDLEDFFEVEVQEQRDHVINFVDLLDYIVHGVQASLSGEQIGDFDCLIANHFLQEFTQTLNRIQII